MGTLLTSFFAATEDRRYKRGIASVQLEVPPLFILGHWRSGTTYLHTLVAADKAQFSFPSGFQVINPHTFLTLSSGWRPANRRVRRPMDALQVGPHDPQEEEFAMLLLTLMSPYMRLFFPSSEEYSRYLTLRDLSDTELSQWKNAYVWLLKKLTLAGGAEKALVVKSPPNTARVGILRSLFPQARFIHIARNPNRIFPSFRKLMNAVPAWIRLSPVPQTYGTTQWIAGNFRRMYDAYFHDVKHVPASQLVELRLEDVKKDPIGQLRSAYDRLGLRGFGAARPWIERVAAAAGAHREDSYPPMDPAELRVVREACGAYADRWKYHFV